jgi:hypothetical protein
MALIEIINEQPLEENAKQDLISSIIANNPDQFIEQLKKTPKDVQHSIKKSRRKRRRGAKPQGGLCPP